MPNVNEKVSNADAVGKWAIRTMKVTAAYTTTNKVAGVYEKLPNGKWVVRTIAA